MKIFINGPTIHDVETNIRMACSAGVQLLMAGKTPYIANLRHLVNIIHPVPSEVWDEYDKEWMEDCEAVVQLPGKGQRSERILILAEKRDLPVFGSVEELLGLNNEKYNPYAIKTLSEEASEQSQ